MVRKRIENVAEIRDYTKVCCKFELSANVCVIYGDKKCHFPQFIGGLQYSVPVRNPSDVLYSGGPRSAVTKSNITEIKSVITKDAHFVVRQLTHTKK